MDDSIDPPLPGEGDAPAAPTRPKRVGHRDTRNKRNEEQKRADEAFIARLRLRGKTLSQICEELNQQGRPYTLSRAQVAKDLDRIEKAWFLEATASIDKAKGRELTGLAMQEQELWDAWDRSKLDATTQRVEQEGSAPKEGETSGVLSKQKKIAGRESQNGDPAYMRLILEIRDRRTRILGLNAPVKSELAGPDGGPIQTESTNTNLNLTRVLPADVMGDAAVDDVLRKYYGATAPLDAAVAEAGEAAASD